ncbi:hypothetical protein [Halomonas getboli]|uniref:hypothetical protein n=1 Tax=Halomonas getboli TaxID=2935862 RepID=UPI001FFE8ABF|nr:hypothetical protein [Halomonas getboli]MCK2185212.1 hypothetical protein [Halomonas getboli]
MAHHIRAAVHGTHPIWQVCDVSACAVRMAWAHAHDEADYEDPASAAMRREEAIAEHQRRFLRTTERYLRGELGEPPKLGAWRRK